jgi:hypothetical protein
MSPAEREEKMRTVSIGLVLFLVMTFTAPLLSFADELSLSLTTNGTYGLPGYFVPGTKLEVSVSIQNPGLPTVVDFYFGYLLPVPCGEPGDTVVFFTDPLSFASGVGSVANPATLRPIVAGVDLTTPFTFSRPTFFSYSWTGQECGWHLWFLAAVKSGALVDNSIDAGDILALSTARVWFDPWAY